MPIPYENEELLHEDDFAGGFGDWHHEGIGTVGAGPEGGMRLHCQGSAQGGRGCMAFYRPTLPDHIACEYEVVIRSHGGLMLNYVAIRGLKGEDMIADAGRLPPREGVMANYWSERFGLQSFHVSISRFDDDGTHTATSNWRRNPGLKLAGHGVDPMTETNRRYQVRLVKDRGHCQLYVDGVFAHAIFDRDAGDFPVPDYGKFGFRLIGSEVMVDIANFRVYRVEHQGELFGMRS